MVEPRCNNCKSVWHMKEKRNFFTNFPQCNEYVLLGKPRDYGKNNPAVYGTE